MNQTLSAFLEGLGTGAGLIMAIGAQNAFVLKQGILKNHVFITAFLCATTDALFISAGVGGFGSILASNALLLMISKWGGAAFLGYYGFRSFKAAFKNQSLEVSRDPAKPSLKETLVTIFAVSFLNPHCYLDTVVLLGSIGAQFPEGARFFFGFGAFTVSFLWFFSLCYGARYLAPLFKNPTAWKILDFLIGIIMWGIAISLIV